MNISEKQEENTHINTVLLKNQNSPQTEPQLPMPVVEYIALLDSHKPEKGLNEDHISSIPAVSLTITTFFLICFLMVFMYVKYKKHVAKENISESAIKPEFANDSNSLYILDNNNNVTISMEETEKSGITVNSPYHRAQLLKDEREKHAREIARLLSILENK